MRISHLFVTLMLMFAFTITCEARTNHRSKPTPPYTATGSIVSFETTGIKIRRDDSGGVQLIFVSSKTKVKKDGKPATLDDLKAGDQVKMVIGGTGEALSVDVLK